MKTRLPAPLVVIVCLLLSVTSCNDDNEPKDTTAPEITFTNLAANQEVKNTITISLDAKDNGGIDKIEIFIDGNQITTITQAPFETSWDSHTVSDGPHTVKVVATDKSHNAAEASVIILVKNALLSDFLTGGNQKAWRLSSVTPDEPCGSSSDDQWIFFANGSFEYNHGTVTEDKVNKCSDFVNLVGTWMFTNNETGLRIIALHEKGNTANAFTITILDGSIITLNDSKLRLTQIDPGSGVVLTIEFTKI